MQIKKAAVLGAGVMGAQIAAHLANAGIPCLLLDIVPRELTPEEQARGLTLESRQVRNRIAQAGLDAAKKAKPAAFYSPEAANLVTPGNFDDDLPKLKDCDWVIEAIIENLQIKRSLFERVERHLHPTAIISSNTSGIPIAALAEGRSVNFRQRFLGTHFFNPPRYLYLLELITTPETDVRVSEAIADFCDQVLGKGIVRAKDTPNFIANRIGTFSMLDSLNVMLEGGYTTEEIDAITGTVIGHAKSASFRTLDLVGLDTFVHVAKNLYEAIPNDEKRESFRVPQFMQQMIEKKLLGDKTRGGFFKKSGDVIQTLDLNTFEYRERQKPKFASLDAAKQIEQLEERLRTLVYAKDRAGEFLWRTVSESLIYAANRIPEIADDIVEVDNAMKWGFAHELGVFETWDAIGVETSVARLKEEGRRIPANVEKMLAGGAKSFYRTEDSVRHYFDFATGIYRPVRQPAGITILKSLKDRNQVIKKNSGASLIDLGDGVAIVEFHSKMNALGQDQIGMIQYALKEVEKNFAGLVIGNQGENFSAGANIMMILLAAQEGEWDELALAVRQFQNTTMSLRYSPKPVVVAPHHLTLGGGCEMVLHADRAVAAAETYIGLVEVGVGLLPGGGGTKEMAVRAAEAVEDLPTLDQFEVLKRNFEMTAMGKVATSATEAKHWGLMRKQDRQIANQRRVVEEAKQTVLTLVRQGYIPPQPRTDVLVLGEAALTKFKLGLHMMKRGGYISDHEVLIGTKIATVMSGGNLTRPTRVSESYLLDLEREAFVSLCGTKATQERIAHMLKTGKPLRN
ncbi:MAG TPA: 3-hydroxyacyl-CoA dehydrogenase NAD-binding domain-containing protein [Blastocatellia bacterium]|nr:3-hydroxyacyl-CoA dehydrogenase NAD-binding domain-containing protein [Blastocatellia bacterium]